MGDIKTFQRAQYEFYELNSFSEFTFRINFLVNFKFGNQPSECALPENINKDIGFSSRISEYVTRIRTLKLEFNTYDFEKGDKNTLYAALPLTT